MKTIAGIAGILLGLTGSIWFFQGIGLLPGSFMTGDEFWAGAGILAFVLGIVLIRYWRRSPTDDPPTKPLDTDQQ